MRALFRPLLLLTAVLLVPILPFVLFGPALESRMTAWLDCWVAPRETAMLVIGLLSTDILLPVPSSLVSTLGGTRLGWLGGTAASWAGMSLGAVLGFALARYGGRPLALRLSSAEELERMEGLSDRHGPMLLVVTRAVPVLAEACVLWMGLERLAWPRFLAPVLLSNLGISLAYSAFGSVAARYHWLPLAMGLSLALPLVLTMAATRTVARSRGSDAPTDSTESA